MGAIEMAAVKTVHRRVGARVAGRVFLHLRRRERDGEPFGHLPAARSEGETLSRALAGAAVRLFRELNCAIEVDDPMALTSEAVELGMVEFLKLSVGEIRRDDWLNIDEATRTEWVGARTAGLPGVEIRWDHVAADALWFTVTSCRLAQLCAVAGEGHLARLFCRGEARFLAQIESHAVLIRDRTIAAGGEDCPFQLRFRSGS